MRGIIKNLIEILKNKREEICQMVKQKNTEMEKNEEKYFSKKISGWSSHRGLVTNESD